MDEQELSELHEKAHHPEARRIALTMAIVAVLLAVVTMMGHRTHTEEVVLQTRTNDQWTYYQAKNNRAQMYAADAKLAGLLSATGRETAEGFASQAEHEKAGADDIKKQAEVLEEETKGAETSATRFDVGEIFLEVSIVLCSIALLTGSPLYWRASFLSSIVAMGFAVAGFLHH